MFLFGDAPSGDFSRTSDGMAASGGKEWGTNAGGREIPTRIIQPGPVFRKEPNDGNPLTRGHKIEYARRRSDRTPTDTGR